MSQRPLDQIRQETKKASRAPHLRKNNITPADSIDTLDNIGIGGAYHHEGPYDATLASRNKHKKFSPVEAVKESNMEALKATPYVHVQDSLVKHVPLSGTAVIPPGMSDFNGNTMNYEEGADLMREQDAPGGAYGRYEHIPYHPNDLKGKGEPSYTIERDLKEQKRTQREWQGPHENAGGVYEMQPAHSSRKDGGTMVRQRSYSASDEAGPSANGSDVRRSNTTGKPLQSLKRRLGSLRRKPADA